MWLSKMADACCDLWTMKERAALELEILSSVLQSLGVGGRAPALSSHVTQRCTRCALHVPFFALAVGQTEVCRRSPHVLLL